MCSAKVFADDSFINIVLLGDSYTSGNGAGKYYGPPLSYRSMQNWGHNYSNWLNDKGVHATVHNYAWSGNVTKDVLNNQIAKVSPDTDLVMFTIGGNDVEFENIVRSCFTRVIRQQDKCQNTVLKANQRLLEVKSQTIKILTELEHKLKPDARVIIVGYPLLAMDQPYYVPKDFLGITPGDWDAAKAVRELGLNASAIQKELVTEWNKNHKLQVTYVPMAKRFAGHEPDPKPDVVNPHRWLNEFWEDEGVVGANGEVTSKGSGLNFFSWYHPNITGHQNMAAEIAAVAGIPSSIRDTENFSRSTDAIFVLGVHQDNENINQQIAEYVKNKIDKFKEKGADLKTYLVLANDNGFSDVVAVEKDQLLDSVKNSSKTTKYSSRNYPVAGISKAVYSNKWRSDTRKVIYFIGDIQNMNDPGYPEYPKQVEDLAKKSFELDTVEYYAFNTRYEAPADAQIKSLNRLTGGVLTTAHEPRCSAYPVEYSFINKGKETLPNEVLSLLPKANSDAGSAAKASVTPTNPANGKVVKITSGPVSGQGEWTLLNWEKVKSVVAPSACVTKWQATWAFSQRALQHPEASARNISIPNEVAVAENTRVVELGQGTKITAAPEAQEGVSINSDGLLEGTPKVTFSEGAERKVLRFKVPVASVDGVADEVLVEVTVTKAKDPGTPVDQELVNGSMVPAGTKAITLAEGAKITDAGSAQDGLKITPDGLLTGQATAKITDGQPKVLTFSVQVKAQDGTIKVVPVQVKIKPRPAQATVINHKVKNGESISELAVKLESGTKIKEISAAQNGLAIDAEGKLQGVAAVDFKAEPGTGDKVLEFEVSVVSADQVLKKLKVKVSVSRRSVSSTAISNSVPNAKPVPDDTRAINLAAGDTIVANPPAQNGLSITQQGILSGTPTVAFIDESNAPKSISFTVTVVSADGLTEDIEVPVNITRREVSYTTSNVTLVNGFSIPTGMKLVQLGEGTVIKDSGSTQAGVSIDSTGVLSGIVAQDTFPAGQDSVELVFPVVMKSADGLVQQVNLKLRIVKSVAEKNLPKLTKIKVITKTQLATREISRLGLALCEANSGNTEITKACDNTIFTENLGAGVKSEANKARIIIDGQGNVTVQYADGSQNLISASALLLEYSVTAATDQVSYHQGDAIKIVGYGFEPGRKVTFELHSTPIVLGDAIVNSDGTVGITANLPADTELGTHEVVLNQDGLRVVIPIKVVAKDQPVQPNPNPAITPAKPINSAKPSVLPQSGVDLGTSLGVGLLALLAGAYLLRARRRGEVIR